MIRRRSPIQSAIAGRKLFAGGGMVAPMQQPMGILSSSQSLVDAVAATANNPMGGNTLPMAQGGAVGFQDGGVQYDPSNPMTMGRSGAERMQMLFPAERAAGLFDQFGIGKGRGETYPDTPSMTRRIVGVVPGRVGTALQGVTEVAETVANSVDSFLGQRFRGQRNILAYLFSGKEEASGRSLDERYALKEILSSISTELKQQNPNIERDILEIGADLIGKTGSQVEFKQAIANRYANQQEAGYRMALGDANRGPVDSVPEEGFPTEPGSGLSLVGRGNLDPEALQSQVDAYRVAMGQGPEAQQEFAANLSSNPAFSREFKDAVFQSADVGHPFSKAEADAPRLDEFITEREYPDPEAGDFEEVTETREVPDPRQEPSLDDRGELVVPVERPASDDKAEESRRQIRDAANAGDTKKTTEGIKAYIQEFKEAIPKYEGKSESEKGWDIVKMGMAIAAGESPNAITNIAKGVMATIDNFTSDDKERRTYKRQVDLSAAKYALSAVGKDRAQEIALAAEGRKRPYELVALEAFDFEGRPIKKGQAFPGTEQQLRDGLLEKYPLTYAKTYIANAKAVAALAKEALGARVNPESFGKVQAQYLDDLDNFKSGVRMKAVLRESARLAISGEVLGGTALLKDYANKAMNALGVQMKDRAKFLQDYSSTKREAYSAKQKRLGTLMATQLLRESSKTLSDYDRKRVEELIGALTGTGESVWASEDVLKDRLINLETSIDEGINRSSNSMKMLETTWRNEITKGGTALGPILLRARQRGLGETTQLGGSPTARSYLLSDIYDRETKKFKKGFRPGINK